MDYLKIINFGFVLLFGVTLSLSFSDMKMKGDFKQYLLVFSSLGIIQIIVYYFFGDNFLYKAYPLLTHLPLFLMLKFYYKKSIYMSAIAVLSAYLFLSLIHISEPTRLLSISYAVLCLKITTHKLLLH